MLERGIIEEDHKRWPFPARVTPDVLERCLELRDVRLANYVVFTEAFLLRWPRHRGDERLLPPGASDNGLSGMPGPLSLVAREGIETLTVHGVISDAWGVRPR